MAILLQFLAGKAIRLETTNNPWKLIQLRAGLDCGEDVHLSKQIRGMEQYNWLLNALG